MKWLIWPGGDRRAVEAQVAAVALLVEDEPAFRARAEQAARALGPSAIRPLRRLFHRPPPKPGGLTGRFSGFGEWMEYCQFAIFEILYHLGAHALPLLRRVAFGAYDWTQPKAINVLCRLAFDGVERDQTAAEVARCLPRWQYETQLGARSGLARLAAVSPAVLAAYDALIGDWQRSGDPPDAYELVAALALHAPDAARRHAPFLRQLMHGQGLAGRSAMLDEKVRQTSPRTFAAISGIEYPRLPGYHEARAAALIVRLFPGDPEATALLSEGARGHPDESMRKMLERYVKEHPELGIDVRDSG